MAIISWAIQSIRYLDVIFNKGAKISHFIELTIYLLPLLLFIILPISAFLTVYYSYKKMLYNKEILVLYSIGINRVNILKIFVYFSLFVAALHWIISVYLLPISTSKFKDLKLEINQSSIVNLLQFNTFISKINGLTIYIKKREDDNLLKNIFLFNSRNPSKDVTYIANSGKLQRHGEKMEFILYNGSRLEFDQKTKKNSLMKFSKSSIDINNIIMAKKDFVKDDAYEMSISKLLFFDGFSKNAAPKFRAHGHFRLIWPSISLSIVVAVFFFLTQDQFSREKSNNINVLAFFAGVFVIIINLILYMLLNRNPDKFSALMYVVNICIPVILIVIMYKKNKEQLKFMNTI
ncbi:MAG: lipopolysaccharide export system permease protein [Candidatus Midichloriaceae bacterium]|jgi:lipopolysaccharide export system permease protein